VPVAQGLGGARDEGDREEQVPEDEDERGHGVDDGEGGGLVALGGGALGVCVRGAEDGGG
jgi:hypothetical protein